MKTTTPITEARASYESPSMEVIIVSTECGILQYSGAGGEGSILDTVDL